MVRRVCPRAMVKARWSPLLCAVAMTLLMLHATTRSIAADPKPAAAPSARSSGTNAPAIRFTLPKASKLGLKRQVNAGSRSGTQQSLSVAVIAPDGLAWCASGQPVLWWWTSAPTTNKVEFTLNRGFQTMVKVELPGPHSTGFHAIKTAELAKDVTVNLEPRTPYEWAVRVKTGEDPSTHPTALGWVEFHPLDSSLQRRIKDAPPAGRAAALAAEGYWYEAFDLAARSDAKPAIPMQELLRQVGLAEMMAPK